MNRYCPKNGDSNIKKPEAPPKLKGSISESKLTRKPSFNNRKPPLIKQTKTSMYRMLKANPLLAFENDNILNTCSTATVSVQKPMPCVTKKTSSNVKLANTSNLAINSKQNSVNKLSKKGAISVDKPTKTLRRSLSAGEMEFKKPTQNLNDKIAKNNSEKTLNISPIKGEKRSVSFKTPSAYHRRSVAFVTPNTPFVQKRCSTPYASSTTQTGNDLQKRLNSWLRTKGKSVTSYHHLKCFNVKIQPQNEEDKENVEAPSSTQRSESYENLHIDNDPKAEVCESENLKEIAKDALNDLHKLILEGFPQEQCDTWLQLVKEKCLNIEEEPQFWECRAAIEQTRGNITTAVEFYRTAIVQGAEVKKVDQSLEQLLQKFSLLNISTDNSIITNGENNENKKKREKIILDARNAFKSTIIKFAIQERALKNKNVEAKPATKFVATPVRRSSRISTSKFKSTPGVKVCSSLQELHDSVKETYEFNSNKALFVRYGCD